MERLGRSVPLPVFVVPAAMLLIALATLPYGYYQLLRLVTAASAGWIAVAAWRDGREAIAAAFAVTALTFNPVIPIHLDRNIWSVLNVIGAGLFAAGALLKPRGVRP